ncbi:Pancreatic triacylglycerol lipase [Nymphon striatum]|nr:Pancreatic triacylglycerol lipase [Nymphon striatum]
MKVFQLWYCLVLFLTASAATHKNLSRYKRDLTVCYDKIGCFGDGGIFYDLLKRPISKLPGSPRSLNIEFRLYTRANGQKMEKLFVDNITVLNSSTFNPANEVKFIIHGYGGNGGNEWVLNMTKELLVYADFNVIVVNWDKGARSPYSQAAANTRVVGAWLAVFINFLENGVGVKEGNCHVIGHSLGAHVSGYCGERLKSLGRISGLDPAYPMFEGMDKRVTLDSTDANFVDVIHTNGHSTPITGFGVNTPLGHLDLYPNGGMSQPGCGFFKILNVFFTEGFDEGKFISSDQLEIVILKHSRELEQTSVHVCFCSTAKDTTGCSHSKVIEYFTESINTNCPLVMFQCSSWSDFQEHKCGDCDASNNSCVSMGFHANSFYQTGGSKKIYYGKTREHSPFCYHNYKLTLKTEAKPGATDISGSFLLSLVGASSKLIDYKLYDEKSLKHPGAYQSIITSSTNLGLVSKGSVVWKDTSYWTLCFFCTTRKMYIRDIEIRNIQASNTRIILPLKMNLFQLWYYLVLFLTAITSAANHKNLSRYKRHLTVCYDKIGCFGDGGIFFDLFKRPISKLPRSPLSNNIEFRLYTRANGQKMEKLFVDNITVLNSSTFNPANEVKFIIHGYGGNGGKEWVLNMTKELLVYADYNVIVVNWDKGARSPYSQAAANTRVVGAWLAVFINFLENGVGVKEENCHVIGHSLGAHASGYCGERLKSLGRISGLDPAYPMFEGMDKRVTLDSTDANFVDVIHTNGHSTPITGFGENTPLGHLDFYPNGGMSQPGCGFFRILNVLFTQGFDEDHNYELTLKTEAKPGTTDISGSFLLSLVGTSSKLIDYKLYDE